MLQNVAALVARGIPVEVRSWQDLADDPKYREIHGAVVDLMTRDTQFRQCVQSFVDHHLAQSQVQPSESSSVIERTYVIAEAAMSIFVTECLRYSVEVWEKAPDDRVADPIGHLYARGLSALGPPFEGLRGVRRLELVPAQFAVD